MDFQLSREALLRVLNHVSSIVDSRSTISILSNLYIKCENNQIEIRSTDMDIAIKEFVSADSTKNGEATVNARIFTDIIRKTKKNTIIKLKNEGNRLTINSENSVFELNSLSAEEFPKFVPLDKENSFELNVEQIKKIFTKTKFAGALFNDKAIYDAAMKEVPMGRHAEPQEMAGTVLYLVSDASSYTSGECIVVDGGYTL